MSFLLLLVALLLLVSIWVALVTYSFFWYENGWKARSSPEGRGLGAMVLHGMLSSFASVAFIILTYPLGFWARLWEPEKVPTSGPVIILIHGLYHNAGGWLLFSRHLRKAGFKNIFIMNYGSFFTDFERTFQKLEKFVADASATAPGRPFYLVGHSLGGLLSRVYAERACAGSIPAAVITIGSPHRGSKLAAFGVGELASSLIYQGPLFTRLESTAPGLPCPGLALVSPVDNMVLPSDAHEVPYPGWAYDQTSPLSHTAMLYSKSVATKVIEFIRAGE
jgi:triacylglycerol lipase